MPKMFSQSCSFRTSPSEDSGRSYRQMFKTSEIKTTLVGRRSPCGASVSSLTVMDKENSMHSKKQGLSLVTTSAALILAASQAIAEPKLEVEVFEAGVEGRGDSIGTVTLTAYDHGVLIESDLTGLSPGIHGFHLHENPDCSPVEKNGKTTPAWAAGGHYDDRKSTRLNSSHVRI